LAGYALVSVCPAPTCSAGIVADSNPAAEYEETLAKARGFLAALKIAEQPVQVSG